MLPSCGQPSDCRTHAGGGRFFFAWVIVNADQRNQLLADFMGQNFYLDKKKAEHWCELVNKGNKERWEVRSIEWRWANEQMELKGVVK